MDRGPIPFDLDIPAIVANQGLGLGFPEMCAMVVWLSRFVGDKRDLPPEK